MIAFLFLGFTIGMMHALEADHLAAVTAMSADNAFRSKRQITMRGAVWGLGHTITLFSICFVVIVLGVTLSEQLSSVFELSVGIMLVFLGINVVLKLRKKRVHFHLHNHDQGKSHFHAHSHEKAENNHEIDLHHHVHPEGFPFKALGIGLIHGAAGSAGLLVLAVAVSQNPWVAIGYVALFGLGSILGMAALSFVMAWPLTFFSQAERKVKWVHTAVSLSAAALAVYLGAEVIMDVGPAVLANGFN